MFHKSRHKVLVQVCSLPHGHAVGAYMNATTLACEDTLKKRAPRMNLANRGACANAMFSTHVRVHIFA